MVGGYIGRWMGEWVVGMLTCKKVSRPACRWVDLYVGR